MFGDYFKISLMEFSQFSFDKIASIKKLPMFTFLKSYKLRFLKYIWAEKVVLTKHDLQVKVQTIIRLKCYIFKLRYIKKFYRVSWIACATIAISETVSATRSVQLERSCRYSFKILLSCCKILGFWDTGWILKNV